MRLLTGLLLPEDGDANLRAIGRGERLKAEVEEPWRATCDWPLFCRCEECLSDLDK